MRLGEPAGGAGKTGRGVGSTHASLALSPSPARSPSPPRGHSLARPPVVPAAATLAGPRSRPVSASLPAFLAARKPSRAPPPTRGQRYYRGFARLPVPPELSLPPPVILGSECALIIALPPWPLPGVPALIGGPSKASQTPHSQQFSGKPGPPSPMRPTEPP